MPPAGTGVAGAGAAFGTAAAGEGIAVGAGGEADWQAAIASRVMANSDDRQSLGNDLWNKNTESSAMDLDARKVEAIKPDGGIIALRGGGVNPVATRVAYAGLRKHLKHVTPSGAKSLS